MKNFKHALIGFCLLLVASPSVLAQEVRLNGFSAYVFDDKIEGYDDYGIYRSGKIIGGFQWGTGLEFVLAPTKAIELKYLRQDTYLKVYDYKNTSQSDYDRALAVNYILLGANNYIPLANPKVEPYAGASLGMAILNAEATANSNELSATKFAWEIKLGTNIWINEKVGLKLQAGLLSAVQSFGAGLYFGSGGASAGVSTYSSMYQFSLGGGLTIKLGGK